MPVLSLKAPGNDQLIQKLDIDIVGPVRLVRSQGASDLRGTTTFMSDFPDSPSCRFDQ